MLEGKWMDCTEDTTYGIHFLLLCEWSRDISLWKPLWLPTKEDDWWLRHVGKSEPLWGMFANTSGNSSSNHDYNYYSYAPITALFKSHKENAKHLCLSQTKACQNLTFCCSWSFTILNSCYYGVFIRHYLTSFLCTFQAANMTGNAKKNALQ